MSETMFARLASALEDDYVARARPNQLPPEGNWSVWLVMAGRGFGKTWTGAQWVRSNALATPSRIALVGATAADVRDTMVEGQSGILNVSPDWDRPIYEPSKRRITWPNGSIATMFSAEEPERLRGPQHHIAWCDELGAWSNQQQTFDQLQFGMRLGTKPRTLITTTPKPSKLMKALLQQEAVAVTRGSTYDNRANLAPTFLESIASRYENTRLGRQELHAEYLSDTPGALWTVDWLDRDRVTDAPELRRIVVAIDPAVSNTENSDETGIIVAGIDSRGHVYVLEDCSGRYAPHEWARAAVAAYQRHKADRILAEANNGGALVEHTVRTVSRGVPFKTVHASRGKVIRAEPVSAMYEQGKVHHVGAFPALEDQMCAFTSDFDRARMGYSPDRVDALVWCLTEFLPSQQFYSSVTPLRIWG